MAGTVQNPTVSREIGNFQQADAIRREANWALPMSERLALMHKLCQQMGAIKGAAAR